MTQDITSVLQEQFLGRSRSFWHCIQASRFEELRQIAVGAMWRNLVWDWDELCISEMARQTAEALDFAPSEVFAHPQALADAPELAEYYGFLVGLTANELAQIIAVDERHTPLAMSRFLNVVISSRLEGMALGGGLNLFYDTLAENGTL
jgi:hypothetical protein